MSAYEQLGVKTIKECIKELAAMVEDAEQFLDYAEGMNIHSCEIEDGERVMWLEDGMYYIAKAYRIGENDGDDEKAIIDMLEDCGMEFK